MSLDGHQTRELVMHHREDRFGLGVMTLVEDLREIPEAVEPRDEGSKLLSLG
jgi:hypothetical protein